MNLVIQAALRLRWVVLLLALGVVGWGVWAFQQQPIDAYPDISAQMVQVITIYPGRAPEEVERQVTIPVENAMLGVPRVETVRSRTIFGLSLVQMEFEEGTEAYWARQRVTEQLGDIDLPEGVQPQLGPLATGLRRDLSLRVGFRRHARPDRIADAQRLGRDPPAQARAGRGGGGEFRRLSETIRRYLQPGATESLRAGAGGRGGCDQEEQCRGRRERGIARQHVDGRARQRPDREPRSNPEHLCQVHWRNAESISRTSPPSRSTPKCPTASSARTIRSLRWRAS